MVFDSKTILNDIEVLVRKINNDLDKYFKEYYISPDRSFSQEIYNDLQEAYIAFGKLATKSYANYTVFSDFKFEYPSKSLEGCVEDIVEKILNNYDIKIAQNTSAILYKILFWIKDKGYLDYYKCEEIDRIRDKISFTLYVRSHKEYEKVKDLFNLDYLMKHYYFIGTEYLSKNVALNEYCKTIKVLLKSKVSFEDFYKKLSVIPTIEDKHLRSDICVHFKGRVNVKYF